MSRSFHVHLRWKNLSSNLAAEYQITFVQPESHWYGVDPIHVLPKIPRDGISEILRTVRSGTVASSCRKSRHIPKMRIPLPTAAERTVFWRDKTVQQPVYQSADCVVSAW
jgi:hypothetical protein